MDLRPLSACFLFTTRDGFDTVVSVSLIFSHGYFYHDHYRLLAGAQSAIRGVT